MDLLNDVTFFRRRVSRVWLLFESKTCRIHGEIKKAKDCVSESMFLFCLFRGRRIWMLLRAVLYSHLNSLIWLNMAGCSRWLFAWVTSCWRYFTVDRWLKKTSPCELRYTAASPRYSRCAPFFSGFFKFRVANTVGLAVWREFLFRLWWAFLTRDADASLASIEMIVISGKRKRQIQRA